MGRPRGGPFVFAHTADRWRRVHASSTQTQAQTQEIALLDLRNPVQLTRRSQAETRSTSRCGYLEADYRPNLPTRVPSRAVVGAGAPGAAVVAAALQTLLVTKSSPLQTSEQASGS
jgi:hypothetical protein